jgi:putative transposase
MTRRWTFRCYPTPDQEKILVRTFGCCRYVYNFGLQLRTTAFKEGQRLDYVKSSAALTLHKKEPGKEWLNEVSSVPLQQALRHLQTSFVNFFEKRAKYPTFKKKSKSSDAAEYTRSAFEFNCNDHRLVLAKMGGVPLNIAWSRRLPTEPSSVTVIRKPSGRYFVSFVVDVPVHALVAIGQSVGIDFGVSRLATLSTGERVPNPKHGARLQKRLALAQRRLARKVRVVDPISQKKRDSRRRAKQKRVVARIHERIADARKDTINKFTTGVLQRFDTVFVEDLNLRGMVKNHSLARALYDAGIGMAIQMLERKAAASPGKSVVKIDRWFPSSKMCSACGHLLAKLALSVRDWTCPACGAHHDRDENAALNILAVGQTVAAHGGGVRAARTPVREASRRRSANFQGGSS